MELQYIENPVIRQQKTKALVKEIMMTAEPNKWIIEFTSETKTRKELMATQQKVAQRKNIYAKYPLEWAIHEGETGYSIIVRKLETK
jgi:hypothetical protein